MIQPISGMTQAASRVGRTVRRCTLGFLPTIAFLALTLKAVAQFFPNPGGVGGQPPDLVNVSTNQFDLDANGTADFELVNHEVATYYQDPNGWLPYYSTTITLVPLGGCQILASDLNELFAGDVPILAATDTVGPAKPGWHWSPTGHTLINWSGTSFFSGPLAPVWFGIPGKSYIGVSLGTPESPVYGWLCFTSDRRITPVNWGFAREASVTVAAGNPDTAPEFKLKMGRTFGNLPWLSWEPGFGGVIVEEAALGAELVWNRVENPSDPGFRVPNLVLDGTAPPGEVRMHRVRLAP